MKRVNLSLSLLFVFLASPFATVRAVQSGVNKEVVSNATDYIKVNLLPHFYQSLIEDISTVYEVVREASYETVSKKNTLQDRISQFKDGQFLFQELKGENFLSKEKQAKILTFLLYNAFVVFSNEAKKEDLLRNNNVQGIGMLLSMAGISLHVIPDVKRIIEIVHRECRHLKNEQLDDLTYQETVYAIIKNVAEAVVERNIFINVMEHIYDLEKNSLVTEIASYSIHNAKKLKKLK